MRYKDRTSWILLVAIATVLLAVPACTTSTEPDLTLEDLIAQLRIQLSATTTGGGSAAFGAVATPGSNAFTSPPSESQFQVVGPNLNVFTWPIIEDVHITAAWEHDEIRLFWPYLDSGRWPDMDVAGGVRFGNTWIVFPSGGNPNDWRAQHTEWVRSPHERTGTVFPIYEKLLGDPPCNDCPVGQFIAGPSRHVTDQPEYRRRSVIKWFRWGDMSPWVWDQGGSPPPQPGPGPGPELVLTEVHLYITGFSTELAGGTQIDFPIAIGDVDLLELVNQPLQVVEADVPSGTFQHVRFNVDPSRGYVVYGDEQKPLVMGAPSVTVVGPFVVGEEPITTVTLEFDADDSLSENPDGSWTLAPVVTIVVTTG